jgi:hypothetical protein
MFSTIWGFITSDPAEGGRLRQYTGEPLPGCDGCRYITNAVPCDNPDVPLEGRADADIDADLLRECPAQYLFRQLVRTGTDGAVFEEPFRTTAMALGADVVDPDTGRPNGELPPENDGFLREDASLFIVFVSDEDEGARQDGVPVVYYQRLYESLKGRGNENKVKVSAITGWPMDDALPRMDELCGILETTYDKNPSTDDPQAAQVKEVIAASNSGCVDQANDPTDSHPFSETGGRFIDLVCRTRGVAANICDEDYSGVLKDLGANAAGLSRRFPLSRPDAIEAGTDCQLFTQDDAPHILDCDDNGRFDDEVDGILCVTARPLGSEPGTDELLPGPRADTWTWDTPSRSVRFDGAFLPAPGSSVTIRYQLRAPNRQPCP